MAGIFIGLSGFSYAGWKKNFYPDGLPAKQELHYASQQLSTIEINSTFYKHQSPATFQRWFAETPAMFRFAIKGPRSLTHDKRLVNPESSLANFFASGVLSLGEKLGPILWQFPPFFPFKRDRFEHFMAILPKDFASAAVIAKNHSERMAGKVFSSPAENFPLRHAFEFRHPSFQSSEVVALLRQHNHALVFAHAPKAPAFYAEDLTSDFVYWRLHGNDEAYMEKGYKQRDLNWFAKRALLWSDGSAASDAALIVPPRQEIIRQARDIYIYFDNEAKDFAPANALALMKKLQLAAPEQKKRSPSKLKSAS